MRTWMDKDLFMYLVTCRPSLSTAQRTLAMLPALSHPGEYGRRPARYPVAPVQPSPCHFGVALLVSSRPVPLYLPRTLQTEYRYMY